jgi:hypothetical protein
MAILRPAPAVPEGRERRDVTVRNRIRPDRPETVGTNPDRP